MKRNLFLSVIMIAILALSFVACDSSGDSGGSNTGGNLQSKTTFESNTSKGAVTIEVSGDNSERAVASGYYYIILLDGNLIGHGIIIMDDNLWTFQPTYGSNTSFTGTFFDGILTVTLIPSPKGPITGFEGEEIEKPGNINVVGFWDGVATSSQGHPYTFIWEFKTDGTFEVTMTAEGYESMPAGFGFYGVSGNTIIAYYPDAHPIPVKNNSFTIEFWDEVHVECPATFTRRK